MSESLVREAARCVPDVPDEDSGLSRQNRPTYEKAEVTALRNSLAVDGWTVINKSLVPIAPIPLENPRSRLRESLDTPTFTDARNRLDQLDATLDGGNWEAANGVTRGFLASLFVAICQTIENGAVAREESDARKHLAELGFFASARQTARPSPEAEFIWKMSGMMGTEGVHAGESSQETATYRYALALLTADYFVTRLLKEHQS